MTYRLVASLFVLLISTSSKAATLLDSINFTFTEKNSFLIYNPETTGAATQYQQYGEVSIDRMFQIADGYRLDQLQFVFQQTAVSIGAPSGTWSLSDTVISVWINESPQGIIYWQGPPSPDGVDYPGGSGPSVSVKTVDSQSNSLLTFALSGLINATADPLSPFSAIVPSISHQFDFTSPSPITAAVFSYRVDLYDVSVSSVPLPASAWLFGAGLLGLVGLSKKRPNAPLLIN